MSALGGAVGLGIFFILLKFGTGEILSSDQNLTLNNVQGGKEESGQCHLPYKILSDNWRRIHYEEVGQAASHCDTSLHAGWYR